MPIHLERAALCAALWWGAAAAAAPVTVVGTDFDLVYDSALTGSFGTPSLVGNTLFFTPNAQRAESLNGAGTQVLTAALSGLRLQGKNGFRFGAFSLAVFGDYRLSGAGSQVNASGQLRAFDAALPQAGVLATALQLEGTQPFGTADGSNRNWSATARIDGQTAPGGGGLNGLAAGLEEVDLEIDLQLSAYTDPSQTGLRLAFIENKFSGLVVDILAAPNQTLPTPSTLALLAPLLLGGAALRLLRSS